MFHHKNFALNGLFPGLVSHRSVANLGHYEIEVIIRPVTPTTTGGGGGGGWLTPIKDREITVRITKNGETWEASWTTSKYFAEKVITVTAWFAGLRRLMENITVRVKNFGISVKEIFIRGKKL